MDNLQAYRSLDGFELQKELYSHISDSLLYFAILVLIAALLMGVFMYMMRQTIVVMSRLVEYDLRKDIFRHYQSLDTAFYKRNNTGDLMARITEDVTKVRMYLGPAILYGINLSTTVVFVIYSMFQVSPKLTFYTLIPLPILSISIYIVSAIINKKSTVIQQQLARLNSMSQEIYSGIRVVKSYVKEHSFAGQFEHESEDFKNKSLSLAKTNAFFFPVMLLLIGASTIITIYVGGTEVMAGNITAGNIAEFVIYVNMLTWPVTSIGWVASIVQQASASQERINEFLNTPAQIVNGKTPISKLEGNISFNNVGFEYPDTGIVALKNISFSLEKGQKLAIVGKTGSGKTTIAELLLRLYDISSGQLQVDGVPIDEYLLQDLRSRIGYVPQDVFLFSDSVKNNIAYAESALDMSEIERSAQHASIHKEITTLKEGYDTMVGERGVTLSGGQKQRISIARALLKNPDLLILDDSLSAVDAQTEHDILGYFNESLKNKTVIIITHRIFTLLEFDKILVLDEGQIVEEGTHSELLKQRGAYAKMYEISREEQSKV